MCVYLPGSFVFPGETLRLWLCAHHWREGVPQVGGRHAGVPGARGAQEQGIQQESGHVVHWSHHLCE